MGGAGGNPGKSACAFLIVQDTQILYEESRYLGIKTNNEAEYHAIILALNYVSKYHDKNLELKSDSELVIKQLKGEYKIKVSHLKELNQEINDIISKNNIKIKFSNLRREDEFISRADFLVNKELDNH